jgi:type II secretory pathway pseudopilin PulG
MSNDRKRGDSGMTLVELLLAGTLLMVLMGLAFSTLMGVQNGADRTRTQHDLNEEGRNALNRVARELREATVLTYAGNPDGPAFDPIQLVALSLEADFNGDGCVGNACASTNTTTNPESLTYCFNPQGSAATRAYLWLVPRGFTSADTTCEVPGALPILAGNVAAFDVQYRSNEYRFDTDAPAGVTTWRELDQAPPPVGDAGVPDGDINTSALAGVNSVVLTLKMSKDGLVQDYVTQVDMRNKS